MPHSRKRNNRKNKTSKSHQNNIDQMHTQRFGKCHYCEEYGHFEDSCPLLETAAQDQEKGDRPLDNKKKLDDTIDDGELCDICDSKDHSTLDHCTMEYLEEEFGYCPLCEERGHTMYNCELFKKAEKEQRDYDNQCRKEENCNSNLKNKKCYNCQMSCPLAEKPAEKQQKQSPKKDSRKESNEHSRKYCHNCKKDDHFEDKCPLLRKTTDAKGSSSSQDNPPFKSYYFPGNQKSVYVDKNFKFLKVCTTHCVCQMCHSKYSSKLNKKAKEDLFVEIASNDDAIRYCFICGANGLIDSCMWKKQGK